jgi:hypothetical protein
VLTGAALGYWYFEATFPIEIRDSNEVIIGNSFATAQGDWMTENLVPFSLAVTFAQTTATGTLVLKNDNPSGDPVRDRTFIIPVTFKK